MVYNSVNTKYKLRSKKGNAMQELRRIDKLEELLEKSYTVFPEENQKICYIFHSLTLSYARGRLFKPHPEAAKCEEFCAQILTVWEVFYTLHYSTSIMHIGAR